MTVARHDLRNMFSQSIPGWFEYIVLPNSILKSDV